MERRPAHGAVALGAEVVGADGASVGKLVALQQGYLVVARGFLFPTDYFVPIGAIERSGGNRIRLNVTTNEALRRQWVPE